MKNRDFDKLNSYGSKNINIIRFLSEFALRHDFIHLFPSKQLKTFYPDPKELMINYTNKSTFNDLSDIFQPASF